MRLLSSLAATLLVLTTVGCSSYSLNARIESPPAITCPAVPKLADIPVKPVTGKVYGRTFNLERASITIFGLILQQGQKSSKYLALSSLAFIAFPLPFDQSIQRSPLTVEELEGKVFTYGRGQNSLPDNAFKGISLKWRDSEFDQKGFAPNEAIVENDYNLLVQFDQRQGEKLPGKLYLCIGNLATEVTGRFEAQIVERIDW